MALLNQLEVWVAHVDGDVLVGHQLLVVLFADDCGEEKGAEEAVFKGGVVTSHYLGQEPLRFGWI